MFFFFLLFSLNPLPIGEEGTELDRAGALNDVRSDCEALCVVRACVEVDYLPIKSDSGIGVRECGAQRSACRTALAKLRDARQIADVSASAVLLPQRACIRTWRRALLCAALCTSIALYGAYFE